VTPLIVKPLTSLAFQAVIGKTENLIRLAGILAKGMA
jgi:hypothetical protein